MQNSDHSMRRVSSLPFMLLVVMLVILWIAGGASRTDVLGQVVTRGFTWLIAILFIVFAPIPRPRSMMPAGLFLLAAAAIVMLQLVPLPPSLWLGLPGRELLAEAAVVTGQPQPWRPISMSPEATLNSLSSLVVPFVTLLLAAGLSTAHQWRLVAILLGLVCASSVIGLLQFSGAHVDHPLINDVSGAVSASFANRNHFALFAAIGCLLVPTWAFGDGKRSAWKSLAAIGLLVFFALIILATGSRAGLIVGALGIGMGIFNVHRRIGADLRNLPRKVALPLVLGSIGLLACAIILSLSFNRAVSIDRALSMDMGEDLRARALPTVLDMVAKYFPVGTGAGTFDPVYRIAEPSNLLSASYFNHAHNDLLEVILDSGLPALLLLGTTILWWAWKSIQVWITNSRSSGPLQRLGSATLLLVLIASITDYPARTPIIMAIVMIAAIWLSGSGERRSSDPRSLASSPLRGSTIPTV